MKTALAVLSAAVLMSSVALAKDTTALFNVSGWHCEGCSEKTVAAVKQLKGVKDATADFEHKKLTVVYDDEQAQPTDVGHAVNSLHYKVWQLPTAQQ